MDNKKFGSFVDTVLTTLLKPLSLVPLSRYEAQVQRAFLNEESLDHAVTRNIYLQRTLNDLRYAHDVLERRHRELEEQVKTLTERNRVQQSHIEFLQNTETRLRRELSNTPVFAKYSPLRRATEIGLRLYITDEDLHLGGSEYVINWAGDRVKYELRETLVSRWSEVKAQAEASKAKATEEK